METVFLLIYGLYIRGKKSKSTLTDTELHTNIYYYTDVLCLLGCYFCILQIYIYKYICYGHWKN